MEREQAARHRTSADRSGEVPHGCVAGVGDARERGVAVQHVAGDAAVLHAVAHREAVAAAQHGLGRNAGVAAGRAVEFCRWERDEEVENDVRISRRVSELGMMVVMMMQVKHSQTCQSHFTHTYTHTHAHIHTLCQRFESLSCC